MGLTLRLNADTVIHGVLQPLAASQVMLRRLDAHMAEQELDLLQLSARDMAEPRTRATQVVRRQLRDSCLGLRLATSFGPFRRFILAHLGMLLFG